MVLRTLQRDDRQPGAFGERLPVSAVASADNERMVRSYLAALTGDPGAVDDLSQEVFLRALERLDLFDASPDSGALLRGFARRVAFEHFRRTRRSRQYLTDTLDTLACEDDSVAIAALRHESFTRLHTALDDLPIVSRRMLEMRYHDGLDASQIGERLGVSPGSVRVTLLRIRQRLRARML